MSWWPRKRRDRSKDPFDWLEDEFFRRTPFSRGYLSDLDENFRRMREEMDELMRKAREGELKSPEEGGPYVYGWSMRMGPDGEPHVEEFGNTRGIAAKPKAGLPSGREPLVDVVESGDQVKVTAEIPGVSKEDVNLETTENSLVIDVDTEKRRYYKEIDLHSNVDAESAKATYNNGVLEVCLDKMAPKKKGKKINIE